MIETEEFVRMTSLSTMILNMKELHPQMIRQREERMHLCFPGGSREIKSNNQP